MYTPRWTQAQAGSSETARPLTPVRRLVLACFGFSVLAVVVLTITALHVMTTTNDEALQNERARGGRIIDILVTYPQDNLSETVHRLGQVAGLRNAHLADSKAHVAGQQMLPILGGPLAGRYLVWDASLPGTALFERYAPTRLPFAMGAIAAILICLLLLMRQVARIERERMMAEYRSMRDHLTDLPNRAALEHELDRWTQRRLNYSVIAMDLDRFKPVNDLFGHDAGDLALKEVAHRLLAQLQPGEMLARVGGDEFVAIVQRGGNRAVLANLARACITAVSAPLDQIAPSVSVGISLGIVEDGLRHPSGDPLKLADRALYEAKRLHGGAYCFTGGRPMTLDFDPALQDYPTLLAS